MTSSGQINVGENDILGHRPMTVRQWLAVATCVLLNAIDGFDVLSISFAAPGIAAEWAVDRAALGVVLSMELIGMAAGSVLLGQAADRHGRRPTIIACLLLISVGMAATITATSVTMLAAMRLFTGLGIGGMLASCNALVADHASARWRATAVALMAAGFPAGAIIGGSVVTPLLDESGWRAIFTFGAAVTALAIPLVLLLLPESVAYLVTTRRPDALVRANHVLRWFGQSPLAALPPARADAGRARVSSLFRQGLAPVTLLLTAACFLHIFTVYFLLKWLPKIVVDLGYPATAGGEALVRVTTGGLLGGLLFSLLSLRFAPRLLLGGFLLLAAVSYAVLGPLSAQLDRLTFAAVLVSFWSNGALVGIYALAATSFPPVVRSGGVGFVIGVGRLGAAAGPIAGGLLFAAGASLAHVAFLMAFICVAAALTLAALPSTKPEPLP